MSEISPALISDPGDLPLARFLDLPGVPSRDTVLRAIRAGRLSAVYVGREYRVAPANFDAWLASRRVPPKAVSGTLPESIREWAERIAATAPALTPAQSSEVARMMMIARGGVSA